MRDWVQTGDTGCRGTKVRCRGWGGRYLEALGFSVLAFPSIPKKKHHCGHRQPTGKHIRASSAPSTLPVSSPASCCLLPSSVPSSLMPFSLLPYFSPLLPLSSVPSLLSFLPPSTPSSPFSFLPPSPPSSQLWRVNSEPHTFPKQLYHQARSSPKDQAQYGSLSVDSSSSCFPKG